MKDYYGILEVNEKASPEIIEKAYKILVKKNHPDLYSSVQKKEAEQKLKEINEAYNILSDRFLRSQYDLELQKERENTKIRENTINKNMNNNYQNNDSNINTSENENQKNVRNKNNVGTISGIMDLMGNLWGNRQGKKQKEKMNQKDWLALGLTIIVLIIIGLLLWFIPFTNGWMRQLLFENALFNFIGGLFS